MKKKIILTVLIDVCLIFILIVFALILSNVAQIINSYKQAILIEDYQPSIETYKWEIAYLTPWLVLFVFCIISNIFIFVCSKLWGAQNLIKTNLKMKIIFTVLIDICLVFIFVVFAVMLTRLIKNINFIKDELVGEDIQVIIDDYTALIVTDTRWSVIFSFCMLADVIVLCCNNLWVVNRIKDVNSLIAKLSARYAEQKAIRAEQKAERDRAAKQERIAKLESELEELKKD